MPGGKNHLWGLRKPDDLTDACEELRQFLHARGAQGEAAGATDWFLDNYYLITETAQQFHRDLPDNFYRKLPGVFYAAIGKMVPEIFVFAVDFLNQRGADREDIVLFLGRQQEVRPLQIAELWAFPPILRLACLYRILLGFPGHRTKNLWVTGISGIFRNDEKGVATAIQTLIFLKNSRWQEIFNSLSETHAVLATDPAGVYAKMDFQTCDSYRKAIEKLSRQSGKSEKTVAEIVVALAKSGTGRRNHIGYYLIEHGITDLEELLRIRVGLRERLRRIAFAYAAPLYLGSVALATGLLLAGLVFFLRSSNAPIFPMIAILALTVIPASSFTIAWIQWLITRLIVPKRMPRLAFEDGIEEHFKTIVVIPTLFASKGDVANLVDQLELHYKANSDPMLQFAILADYTDASAQTMPDDSELVRLAEQGIARLNARYCGRGSECFHTLIRKRLYNQQEQVWMGWERKRGKLEEFNRMLAGSTATSYDIHIGNKISLENIRFVITLDSDTELPRDAAKNLVSILAHPLNRAVFKGDSVVAGYTVLQPRLDINPEASYKSRFAQIFSGDTGIDIYSRATSDVYQDLFGTGIFVGKGIYDLDAFRQSLDDRVPENALLSHDLFEGINGRAGLVTDVVFYEDYPPNYLTFAKRQHRWIRGDWQLLPWLSFRVPTAKGTKILNPFKHIDRWKIIDNIRRSLHPVTIFALLVSGWSWLPGGALFWTLAAVLLNSGYLLSSIAGKIPALFSKARKGVLLNDAKRDLMAWGIRWSFLPHESIIVVDAAIRTVVRLAITRRRLLEWTTALQTARKFSVNHRMSSYRELIPTSISAACITIYFALTDWTLFLPAAPLLLSWAGASELSAFLARSVKLPYEAASSADMKSARLIARRIWLFFENFVSPVDHWLPPDNVQLAPRTEIAHRTSPTNIGLYLTSITAAYDLGYIGTDELIFRCRKTLQSIGKLKRYRGQLLNWYDTQTLSSLSPEYVSTVDNGNFAAALIALRQTLRELPSRTDNSVRFCAGVRDTLDLLRLSLEKNITKYPHMGAFRDAVRLLRGSYDSIHQLQIPTMEIKEVTMPSLEAICGELTRILHPAVMQIRQASEIKSGDFSAEQEMIHWLEVLERQIRAHLKEIEREKQYPENAAETCSELAETEAMCAAEIANLDFRMLYDPKTRQFHIGLNVAQGAPDENHYDLLASEARLTSIVAIGLGQVPVKHWFHLRRPITHSAYGDVLLSWSGTMFEYLMPLLYTKVFPETLMGRSVAAAIECQIKYGLGKTGAIWGISESAFALRDERDTYQYQAFGVPELGLKRGLANDTVISPYASALAIGLRPRAVIKNFDACAALGFCGEYGPYEAIDYTPGRAGKQPIPVEAYMAHHQGMSLVAIHNLISGNNTVRRFQSDASMLTALHLLHERIPPVTDAIDLPRELSQAPQPVPDATYDNPWSLEANPLHRQSHIISNGSLTVYGDDLGRDGLSYDDVCLRKYSDDLQCGGFLAYLQTGPGTRPVLLSGGSFGAAPIRTVYQANKIARYLRCEGFLATAHTWLLAEDIEVREFSVLNESDTAHRIKLTFYCEPVLGSEAAHDRYPAFSKLFLETEAVKGGQVLLCRRRPRTPEEKWPILAQAISWREDKKPELHWETSRERFIGRNRTLDYPIAHCGGNAGAVLDPCFAQTLSVHLKPGQRKSVFVFTAVAGTKEQVLGALNPYLIPGGLSPQTHISRFTTALLRSLQIPELSVPFIQKLYAQLVGRVRSPENSQASRHPLWQLGLSGNYPVLLIHRRTSKTSLIALYQKIYALWRKQKANIDFLIAFHDTAGYSHDARDRLKTLATELKLSETFHQIGYVQWRELSEADRNRLTQSVTFVVDDLSPLETQLQIPPEKVRRLPPFTPAKYPATAPVAQPYRCDEQLLFWNGLGGFAENRDEYVIRLDSSTSLPAPWCNVITNQDFGCLASERNLGVTWFRNAQENRLTPWSNDPVSDTPSEAVYIRDEEDGTFWTPTPAPCPANTLYEIRHGHGYSQWTHRSHGLEQKIQVGMHPHFPAKIVEISLKNLETSERRLTLTYALKWVLGSLRSENLRTIRSFFDHRTQCVVAQNSWNETHAWQMAFLGSLEKVHGYTTDEKEFFGAGDWSDPDALRRWGLNSNHQGNGSVAALQVHVDIAATGEKKVCFFLGCTGSPRESEALIATLRTGEIEKNLREKIRGFWNSFLEKVRVNTPDAATDILLRWSLYQAISCRVFARCAFYQSSGAFGFRDQLQDAMALSYVAPEIAREIILNASARQFEEGDVLHWWHNEGNRGVRTRCSDDMLWLPYVVAQYVSVTGDKAVLREDIAFLTGATLAESETDRFDSFHASASSATLFDHCLRALRRASTKGQHGLPLMGSGDWNDGMNLVGPMGKGESVWLGFFLYETFSKFSLLCAELGNGEAAANLRSQAEAMRYSLQNSWDGSWYRRAYFDDGQPLGSALSSEAKIDSIAQSWAALSGAVTKEYADKALRSAAEHLIDSRAGIVRLLWPPFNASEPHPGYIQGYPAGIRENAAQYTHAATWLVRAFAQSGKNDDAWNLFRMINPIRHTENQSACSIYGGEPYVLAADVYSVPPHLGRAGWTWYTGSAAWFFRTGIESLLGLEIRWPYLSIFPRIPKDWPESQMYIEIRGIRLAIKILNPLGQYDSPALIFLEDVSQGSRLNLEKLEHKQAPYEVKAWPNELRSTRPPVKTTSNHHQQRLSLQ